MFSSPPAATRPPGTPPGPEQPYMDTLGSRRTRGAEIDVPTAPLGLVAINNLWKQTTGSLSIDLKRKLFKGGAAPGDSLWRVQPGSAAQPSGRRPPLMRPPAQPSMYAQPGVPPGAYSAHPGTYNNSYGAPPVARQPPAAFAQLPTMAFMNTGARVKVMRHIQFGPMVTSERSTGLKRVVPTLDVGVGLAFELDTAELQPQARLKFRDIVSLKALPYPAIKIQKRLALPESSWGLRLSYECPLESLANFYRPPARLLVLIDNMHSNGAQLTQAGLEFNYAGEFLEGRSQLRATGLVALPRELPVVEGQPLVGLELKRLGLKSAW
ncbi:hypothetical protein D9Q98_003557 [Chlorella vulgaris]|uniref:Uncharacterized protein n=1 Tax=Chlorella vulgaris TaxID=3077 RepID=A0A9D4TU83_CHLVU|nr:hypothetical protein D9Q98_003557 [Chlorella vulgaris]